MRLVTGWWSTTIGHECGPRPDPAPVGRVAGRLPMGGLVEQGALNLWYYAGVVAASVAVTAFFVCYDRAMKRRNKVTIQTDETVRLSLANLDEAARVKWGTIETNTNDAKLEILAKGMAADISKPTPGTVIVTAQSEQEGHPKAHVEVKFVEPEPITTKTKMNIEKLTASNIKDRSIDVELGPVTLILGPSMSGKTAILDALRLGLLGYHPKLGKRSADICDLGNGGDISVSLQFTNDQKIERAWRKGKEPSGFQGAYVPPALLDLRHYYDLTGPQRLKYVFDQCALEDVTHKSVVAKVLNIQPEIQGEATHAAIISAVNIVDELARAREDEGATLQEWIEAILVKFQEEGKAARDSAKQLEGLALGATQLKAQESAPAARSVEPELKKLRETWATLRGELAVLEANQNERTMIEERVDGLRRKLIYGATEAEIEVAIKKAESEVELIKGKLAIKGLTPPEMAMAKVDKLQDEESAARYLRNNLIEDKAKIVQKIEELDASGCCPFCQSKSKGWKATLLKQYQKASVECQKTLATAESKVAEIKARLAAAVDERERALHIAQARNELSARLTAINGTDQNPYGELSQLRLALDSKIQYRKELAALEATALKATDPAAIETLQKSIVATTDQITALEAEGRRYVAGRAAAAQLLQSKAAHDQAKAKAEVFKLATEQLRSLQQGMVDKAIGGLLEVARKFTDGILPGKLDYLDGEVGYVTSNGVFVKQSRTFSGTETAISFAGFSVALAQQSRFKIVIIDELGISDRKREIVDRMIKLQWEGVIDQAILADASTRKSWGPTGGLTIIETV